MGGLVAPVGCMRAAVVHRPRSRHFGRGYDFELTAAPPAAGRTATDSAVTSANMVRANVIFDAWKYPADRQLWSSDDFASLLASAVFSA